MAHGCISFGSINCISLILSTVFLQTGVFVSDGWLDGLPWMAHGTRPPKPPSPPPRTLSYRRPSGRPPVPSSSRRSSHAIIWPGATSAIIIKQSHAITWPPGIPYGTSFKAKEKVRAGKQDASSALGLIQSPCTNFRWVFVENRARAHSYISSDLQLGVVCDLKMFGLVKLFTQSI